MMERTATLLDGQSKLASPASPVCSRREIRFCPLNEGTEWQRLTVVLVRDKPDEAWAPVLLRVISGGRVLLAASVDRAGTVKEWLELWLQTTPENSDGALGDARYRNNAMLDGRWDAMAAAFVDSDRVAVLVTGFEHTAPLPLWIDLKNDRPWPGQGGGIELCSDEAILAENKLDTYAGSLSRYLWSKGQAAGGFLKVAGAANDVAQEVPEWAKDLDGMIAINPQAGRILVRRHAPFDLNVFADFLGGRSLARDSTGFSFAFAGPGGGHAGDTCDQLQQNGAYFVPTTRGLAGRFLETFHLKLMLFTQVVRAVREHAENLQLPMLSLDASSFRIDFAAPAAGLPILWTARAALVDASVAQLIPLPSTERRRFQRMAEPLSLIYSAPEGTARVRGEGTMRIRKYATEGNRAVLRLTLATDERVVVRGSELACVEIPMTGGAPLPLYGRLDAAEAMNTGELRFVSFPSVWPEAVMTQLSRLEGHVFPQVRFEIIPHIGARQDLYSLGVIGARILLAHPNHSLAETVDEILSLAKTMNQKEGVTAGQCAQELAQADERWHAALGPQHHGHDCAGAEEGYRWIPMELWWDAVATLSRFFPGAGGYSYAPDFDEPTELPLQFTYDAPLRELERLVMHSRSLLLSDWLANREVARVIDRLR
ncbi:MAG: hypothetical protein IPP19_10350 [Verrucomicrobia bacterium]|nr:hypothetical protein [Verrucomicrobiota bacterium]